MPDFRRDVNAWRGEPPSHIPPQPLWVAIVRIVQIFLAVLTLALTAYSSSVWGSLFFTGYPMNWFTSIWTILFIVYLRVSASYYPIAYNYWAHLALESLTALFWLVTFALLASQLNIWSGAFNLANAAYPSYTNPNYSDLNSGQDVSYPFSFEKGWSGAMSATKAAVAFGTIEWALFVITLISFGIALHRHRLLHRDTQAGHVGGVGGADAEYKMAPVSTQNTAAPQEPMHHQYAPAQVPHQMSQQQQYQQNMA